MKRATLYLLLISTSLFTCIFIGLGAPPEDDPATDEKLRPFGFGLRAATFTKLEVYGMESPTTLISLVITPHKNFRLEPEVGYFSSKIYDGTLKENLVDKNIHIGLGIYGMINKGSTNIYIGLRASMENYKYEYVKFDNGIAPSFTPSYSKDEIVDKQILAGLVIGAEYMFANHFGFGGEIGIMQAKYHSDINGSIEDHDHKEDDLSNLLTDSGLFVRFYF